MIKVQLCPPVELEDAMWYRVDLLALVCAVIISFGGITYLAQHYEEKIAAVQNKHELLKKKHDSLKDTMKRVTQAQADITEITQKIASFPNVGKQALERFNPLVMLEQIQRVKPRKVWLTAISMKTGGRVDLTGSSVNQLELAELLMALEKTQIMAPTPLNLLTQLSFDRLVLLKSQQVNTPADQLTLIPHFNKVIEFKIQAMLRKKEPEELLPLSSPLSEFLIDYANQPIKL